MKPEIDYSLYLVTDRALMSTPTLEEAVEQAIQGGATLIQLREKDISSLDFYETAMRLKPIVDAYHIPLIINDRVDIALAADTAGVHIGQTDLPAKMARSLLGSDKILGVSVSSVREAVQAQQDGADYLGVGAMFPTNTKTDADYVSEERLKEIRAAVSLPMVLIGGLNQKTIPRFNGTGVNGVAVVSALISAVDIAGEARTLKHLSWQMQGKKDHSI